MFDTGATATFIDEFYELVCKREKNQKKGIRSRSDIRTQNGQKNDIRAVPPLMYSSRILVQLVSLPRGTTTARQPIYPYVVVRMDM